MAELNHDLPNNRHPVYDGDTVHFKLSREYDLGFRKYITFMAEESLRLRRIDTPELRGKKTDPENYAAAVAARDRLREILGGADRIVVQSYKEDNFSRWLGDIWVVNGEEAIDVNWTLYSEGHAVEYEK